ncbi:MAG: hypothetical protein K0R28_2010, partial [Paenibacillus sp.]|nr:hypothetical protein [Paenibacillus sp.]
MRKPGDLDWLFRVAPSELLGRSDELVLQAAEKRQ